MTNLSEAEIITIAEGFRKSIIRGNSSEGYCYAVCAPLHEYLGFLGLSVRLIEGEVQYDADCNHFWIEFPDGRVLDPTADQFNGRVPHLNEFPQIYLGPANPIIHHLSAGCAALVTDRESVG